MFYTCSLIFNICVVVQGIPTLLMAAGSFDDVLAITGFSTCLGIAFSTGQRRCSPLLSSVLFHSVLHDVFSLQVPPG